MNAALQHAADTNSTHISLQCFDRTLEMSLEQMKEVPIGDKRRNIHDDITFIIADLRNQTAN